jgi:predicted nucleotidyltransferase
MKKEQILNYLANVKNEYQKEGFIIKALFGSYSRDEEQENSDIDVLLMKNEKGDLVLIDLDRFNFNGIKGIDKLHFFIEKECKEKGIVFFEWIDINFDKYNKELLFLYFVYRINIEHFEKVKLPKFYYNKSCQIFNRFIKEFC